MASSITTVPYPHSNKYLTIMSDNTNFPEPLVLVQNVELCLPIYQFDLSNDINTENTISKIRALKETYPSTTITNVVTNNGWRSPYLPPHDPAIKAFTDEITCIQTKLKQVNSFDTSVVNLWAVIYGKEDFSKTHNHFSLWDNLAYNAILYLSDSNTPLVFETTNSKVEIFPKKGMLVVMHPLTRHFVPPVNDDSERIILVCNLRM